MASKRKRPSVEDRAVHPVRFGECGSCHHWRHFDSERRQFIGQCEHPTQDGQTTDRYDTCEDYTEKNNV